MEISPHVTRPSRPHSTLRLASKSPVCVNLVETVVASVQLLLRMCKSVTGTALLFIGEGKAYVVS